LNYNGPRPSGPRLEKKKPNDPARFFVPTLMNVNLSEIRAARERIAGAIYHSPCPYSLSLSRLCGAEIYCKLDHLQMTGSFKERGARNKLMSLTDEQKKRGVIAASAGNHALGLAYHGQLLGIPVTVIMPKWAPIIKVSNCRSFGANIVLHGESYDDARKLARQRSEDEEMPFISGFDDPYIINGAGTMGLEILEDVPGVDAIVVPIGGGGLIAGIGAAVKAAKPSVQIIGVEPVNAASFVESMKAGKVTRFETKPTLADGLAVAELGTLCFEIAKTLVDQTVLVDEPQIAQAVLRLLELEKTVVEGAGAVPLAAMTSGSLKYLAGKKVVLCLCGGNIDATVISRVIERGLAAEGRLCRITAFISDRPGSLAKLLGVIADTGASIKEVEHDRHFGPADVAKVAAICIVETRDADHIRQVREAVKAANIELRE
jgi:threonine dehydratase